MLCGAGAAKAWVLPGKAIVQSGINIAHLKQCTRTAPDGDCDPFASPYFINPPNPAPGIGLYNLFGDSEPEVITLAHHNNHMSTWELGLDGTLLGTTELPNTPSVVGFGVGDFGTSSPHFFIAYMSAGVDLRVRVLNRNGQDVTTIDLPEVPDIYGFALIDGSSVTRFSFLHRNPAIGGAPLLISTYGTDGALVSERPISRGIYPVGGFTYRNDSERWYILQGFPGTNVATLWSYLFDGTQEEQLNLYDVHNEGLRGLAVLPSKFCQDDDNNHIFSGNWCDGKDNDCDDLIDEDYGSTPESWGSGVIQCAYCAVPGTCANGQVTPTACAQDCQPAPAIPVGNTTDSGWQQFGFAFDFDVADDKLCYVIPLPGFGVVGQIACTQQLGSDGDLIDAPAEFFNGGGQGVSLDPLGRVWATGANASAIYAQINSPALQFVANKPTGCDSIAQIELVGPADRDFFGLTARPFISCGNGKVFELTPSTGSFIQHAFNSSSLGASPSSGFELFFKTSAPAGGQMIARADAANNVTALGSIGAGDQTALVGGVYIVGNDYAGGPPVVPSNDPGEISQWNGSAIEPVADLLAPLDAPVLGDGKYGVLSAYTLNDGDPRVTFPAHKVVEGGGVGVGGPSPPGLTDVVWVLSNTFRIYGYHLPPIPDHIPPHLLGDDAAP
ncbi:MAG TPA: hypothetical protein VEX18_16765, partial [Polyangiaceae bacterium]|nr:hypothetical protein [Polyangiaceae bacterium]